MIDWTVRGWTDKTTKNVHGDYERYRLLYEGKHELLFPRAQHLIKNGDAVGRFLDNSQTARETQTPYVIFNLPKVIAEIPATMVSGSIGQIKSSITADEIDPDIEDDTDEMIEGPQDEEEAGKNENNTVIDLQNEIIEQITKNSKLERRHWSNIVQHQVDGGIVAAPVIDELGPRIVFKARDVYFPHDDEKGADLAYYIDHGQYGQFLHIYRERVEKDGLRTTNMLYPVVKAQGEVKKEIKKGELVTNVEGAEDLEGEELIREVLNIPDDRPLENFYPGRNRPFISYWANNETFMNPYGISALDNLESKQDEINWTITRSAVIYEQNGKPRISITSDMMDRLLNMAWERNGMTAEDAEASMMTPRIDHRDMEITTFDENGRSMEIHQIDISKIGDMDHVKNLIKLMLIETQTSEKAVDFYLDGGASGAQSGVAKFYDLLTTILKSRRLQKEYIDFLKELYESCLWLLNDQDSSIRIEEPNIETQDMILKPRAELVGENMAAYAASKQGQSLETTVRRMNPDASEDWIQEEIARIEEEQAGSDTSSLMGINQTFEQMNDNRDEDGNIIEEGDTEEEPSAEENEEIEKEGEPIA